jgi:hypothetical protein
MDQMRGVYRFVIGPAVAVALSGATLSAQTSGASPRAIVEQPSTSVVVASPPSPPPAAQTPVNPDSLPVDLSRIKAQAEKLPLVKLDEDRLRFYVLVLGNKPKEVTFKDIVGDYDLMNGPTKGGAPMTYKEYVNMVTPKEINLLQSSTASGAFALLQAAIMNASGQALLAKAAEAIKHAKDEHEIEAIRERINRELAALLGKDDQ